MPTATWRFKKNIGGLLCGKGEVFKKENKAEI